MNWNWKFSISKICTKIFNLKIFLENKYDACFTRLLYHQTHCHSRQYRPLWLQQVECFLFPERGWPKTARTVAAISKLPPQYPAILCLFSIFHFLTATSCETARCSSRNHTVLFRDKHVSLGPPHPARPAPQVPLPTRDVTSRLTPPMFFWVSQWSGSGRMSTEQYCPL